MGTDSESGQLLELTWRPGTSLAAQTVRLSAPIIRSPVSRSLHGDLLLLTDDGHCLMLIDRITGTVTRLANMPAPATLTPDGRAIVSATRQGMLRVPFVPKANPPIPLQFLVPMVLYELDSPRSMMLVPDADPNSFTIAIGDYGRAALAVVRRFSRGNADVRYVPVETEGLPYDPIFLQSPAPVILGPHAHVFVMDEGSAGLGAIELASGRFERCPLDERDYHSVGLCLPRLDGAECLFLARDGTRYRWTPGHEPQPVRRLRGSPVLWDGDFLLLLDSDKGRIWEERLGG